MKKINTIKINTLICLLIQPKTSFYPLKNWTFRDLDLDLEVTWWTKISQREKSRDDVHKYSIRKKNLSLNYDQINFNLRKKKKQFFLLSFSNVTLTLTFRRSLQIQCHIFFTFVSYTTYLKLSKQIFRQFYTKLFEK